MCFGCCLSYWHPKILKLLGPLNMLSPEYGELVDLDLVDLESSSKIYIISIAIIGNNGKILFRYNQILVSSTINGLHKQLTFV